MTDKKIIIKNLYKSFGSKKVLQGIDLDINKGDSQVIIGGSGSGKSVLIKTIIGLLKSDSGIIKIDDKDVTKLSNKDKNQLMKKIGFLFQGGALFDSLTIWQNISFVLINQNKIDAKNAKKHAINKLNQVGLEERVADLYPAELSGGMQKRAALARAISLDPEIIFFDEPTTGLDPISSAIINELIAKTSKDLGATTITITHDLKSAETIGDKIAMIYDGKIVWNDDIGKLYKSNNPIVEQFVTGSTKGPIKVKLQDH